MLTNISAQHSQQKAQQEQTMATIPAKVVGNENLSASPNSVQPTAISSCQRCIETIGLYQNLNKVVFEQALKIAMLEQALSEKTAEVESLIEEKTAMLQ